MPSGEKKGWSPVRLEQLKSHFEQVGPSLRQLTIYDVKGVERGAIATLLESDEGKLLEWSNDKLIHKLESSSKDSYATWLDSHFYIQLTEADWNLARNAHVVTNLGVFIPDSSATYMPGRPRLPHELDHPMSGNTLPHWVLEVEWASCVDSHNLGFSKITDIYFAAVGPNGTRIEEGWVISVPDEFPRTLVNAVPFELQEVIQPQLQRPPADVPFLAILQRVLLPGMADHVRAYYPLRANTFFRVPVYSLLSSAGAGGGVGNAVLVVNRLLKNLGCTFA